MNLLYLTPLPESKRDHILTGNWDGYRECHIAPDWLLIYGYETNRQPFGFV
ncbi:MAG: type II toxin-antitoxin system YafQ family toxin [Lachnospiraceae bacterium]|jgi:mRNA interferase YafQ|nr:type II toxin-antitoxin system YafQ family toxin [Lachnospiraceae bacterium]